MLPVMTIMWIGLALLFIYLSAMVAVVQFKEDTSIGNFTWGGGVMLVTLYTFFTVSAFAARQILVTAMIVAWAGRLIAHVYKRYTGKDPRFREWKWKGFIAFLINCGWIYGQFFMIAIMSYASVLINYYATPLTALDLVGLAVWIFGYIFEAVADYQLYLFTHNPSNKGKVMHYGLWRYSRHPNYFGEVTMWWGIFLLALSVPYGWTAIITPLTITTTICFITGIPWVEKAMAGNPEYQQYKRKTSPFFPWPPKK